MTKEDIKYHIEFEKYKFELEYARDFKGVIIWLAGILALLIEGMIAEKFSFSMLPIIRMIVILLVVTVVVSIIRYIAKRKVFFTSLKELKNAYDKSN